MADVSPSDREPILSPLHRILVALVVTAGVLSFATAIALVSWRI